MRKHSASQSYHKEAFSPWAQFDQEQTCRITTELAKELAKVNCRLFCSISRKG
jgi:hypothetical protein